MTSRWGSSLSLKGSGNDDLVGGDGNDVSWARMAMIPLMVEPVMTTSVVRPAVTVSQAGKDELSGGDGNDTIDAGAGNDFLGGDLGRLTGGGVLIDFSPPQMKV